ncbi:MAG: acetylxylan esterase, partial [Opitutaceae bacterium]
MKTVPLLLLLLGSAALAALRAAPPSPAQEQAWRDGIRAALFVPSPLPDLAARDHGSFSPEPGIIVDRVTYASQFGLRIPALVYRPAA